MESPPVSRTANADAPPALVELEMARRAKACSTSHTEPVRAGVPFPQGKLRDVDDLSLDHENGRHTPLQTSTLERWPDGSVRWALVEWLAHVDTEADGEEALKLRLAPDDEETDKDGPPTLEETDSAYLLGVGNVGFRVPRSAFAPFTDALLGNDTRAFIADSRVEIEGERGEVFEPRLDSLDVETVGCVRTTLHGRGRFVNRRNRALCEIDSRVSFFTGTGLVRMDLTVRNPRAAKHPGGRWDLGDAGSIFFRELRLVLRTDSPEGSSIRWINTPDGEESRTDGKSVEIRQDSSGGDNWRYRNHVDRRGKISCGVHGCRVKVGEATDEVRRASPVLALQNGRGRLSVGVPRFWQEFPKALECRADEIRIALLARQGTGTHELQGGEQKTFTAFFLVERPSEGSVAAGLGWIHAPLVPRIDPRRHIEATSFPHLVPLDDDPHPEYVRLVNSAIDGPTSFHAKRETIDEYGWRHFGDMPADHENAYFDGEKPVVSHYNNQYDLVFGLLLHFARSGDTRWHELAGDLARHVIDIDIYHTTRDKPAYNQGYFWHTDHYADAGRSTHRTYTGDCARARSGQSYGGGPANEHNYTSGLLQYYFLTGDPLARDAVLGLADWVVAMDDGACSALSVLDNGPTGLASSTFKPSFHGPGRGAGHSVNALLDAHRLRDDAGYLAKAENIIRRVIHPHDDLEALDLLDPESRWSYIVFLQILGKYLDLKTERNERDETFGYARAGLSHYARWMLDHETPFHDRFELVEYPTETWPAQDMRKSCVFDYACVYGPEALRERFKTRAEEFFRESVDGVASFDTRHCTRPLAILLGSGTQHGRVVTDPPLPEPPQTGTLDFGSPTVFLPQKARIKNLMRSPRALVAIARLVTRPRSFARLLKEILS